MKNPQKNYDTVMEGGWEDFLEHLKEAPIMERKFVDTIVNARL